MQDSQSPLICRKRCGDGAILARPVADTVVNIAHIAESLTCKLGHREIQN